jgi:mannose-6-phosphate isomerase class I
VLKELMHLIVVDPSFQNYAWGDNSFIPGLFGLKDSGLPYAEAWFGAHPSSPSLANLAGERVPLDQLIAKRPAEILGSEVAGRFPTLPFLLKILAAARPLSVQVHPSKEQAIVGFRRENAAKIPLVSADRNYRDANPKPEAIFALTPFEAMCGFRPIRDIGRDLAGTPEFGGLFPGWEQSADPLRTLLGSYFELPHETVQAALGRWISRLASSSPAMDTIEKRIIDASRVYSVQDKFDRGLLFFLLLNFVTLNPGEGLFLSAGTPHAYLRGAAVEVMSSSDNVIRAGLTTKHVDTIELMSILRFESGPPHRLHSLSEDAHEVVYPTPAEEFEISRIVLSRADLLVERTSLGPEILLFLSEDAQTKLRLKSSGSEIELPNAAGCMVPHGTHYSLNALARGNVFRVRVPDAGRSLTPQTPGGATT